MNSNMNKELFALFNSTFKLIYITEHFKQKTKEIALFNNDDKKTKEDIFELYNSLISPLLNCSIFDVDNSNIKNNEYGLVILSSLIYSQELSQLNIILKTIELKELTQKSIDFIDCVANKIEKDMKELNISMDVYNNFLKEMNIDKNKTKEETLNIIYTKLF